MKKYLVGGYVRDRLLGKRPKDKDYVLVNATKRDIEYLKSIGFEQVGSDFPVYIDKEGNEHALARTERKVGEGYSGFETNTQGVTLAQDLYRRDLTINAIAFDPQLKVHVDPYNGKEDLKNKILRHVSEHFAEDPVRVLRLARFRARYDDFKVHESTEELVRTMIERGDLAHLTKERVYVEFEKAFSEENPVIFLKKLHQWGALDILLPGHRPNFKPIEHMSKNCTEMYKEYFIWAELIGTLELNDNVFGQAKIPSRFVKFNKFIQKHKDSIKGFRRSTPEEMVNILTEMNVKNNGGEEFLYQVLEYFILRKEIDLDLEDFIIKAYDRFENTVIGDIEQMLKDGALQPKDIREFVKSKRVVELKKIFQ